ncbi:hypothetical protein HHK36_009838 [Tetracentron sinense]|uniref:Uncharacterized protein n=1 Tax=Tetracentron sinense TaxID=13715 RepID=A0A835DHV1_TETSI|nr:hypothetical protein HHK36_009838 [Tetracentron sinense]
MYPMSLVLNSLLVMVALSPIQAIQYQVFNNATGMPGGTRFNNEIGLAYSEQILELASKFIWQTFQQGEGERKGIKNVTMVVESLEGVAYTMHNNIHVSAEYIANYSGDVRIEVIGILYHETTHIWQWKGKGEAPTGLTEGIADYVRLKGGLVHSRGLPSNAKDEITPFSASVDYKSTVRSSVKSLAFKLASGPSRKGRGH